MIKFLEKDRGIMGSFKIFICAIGRVLISTIFISSSIHKILEWKETERGVMSTLSDWGQKTSDIEVIQSFFIGIAPYVDFFIITAVALELIGGLMILLGIKPRIGAFFLFLFMIPTTVLFHAFWFYEDQAQKVQLIMFLKNLAIIGGLFYVMAFGTGMVKKEEKKPQTPKNE